jgi:hypothetical protein
MMTQVTEESSSSHRISFKDVNDSPTKQGSTKSKHRKRYEKDLHCKEGVCGVTKFPVAQLMCYHCHDLILILTLQEKMTYLG